MRLRSLQNKLALLFLAITALAFAAAIFVVLPRLETQLQDERVEDVERGATGGTPRIQRVVGQNIAADDLDELVRAVADSGAVRVTLLGTQRSSTGGPEFYVLSDSNAERAVVDRARKEFIANASHELRTPIFSLAGFMELLEDDQLDDATRAQFLETMREQVERLQKLAVDLLDLSRLDAGSLQLAPEDVDLGELARDVASEFGPAVARHRTELEMQVP